MLVSKVRDSKGLNLIKDPGDGPFALENLHLGQDPLGGHGESDAHTFFFPSFPCPLHPFTFLDLQGQFLPLLCQDSSSIQ